MSSDSTSEETLRDSTQCDRSRRLAGTRIAAGELVRISISAANRDPARFGLGRATSDTRDRAPEAQQIVRPQCRGTLARQITGSTPRSKPRNGDDLRALASSTSQRIARHALPNS
jgi:hypothetical protein